MTKEELRDKILDWTYHAGEDFFDYFAHDQVNNTSWAFWLLGKGFSEHANKIIELHVKDKGYVGQEELYQIYPEYIALKEPDQYGNETQFSDENYHKNIELMAEFLLATPHYTTKVNKWFEEQK
jgi:hypothetical protein